MTRPALTEQDRVEALEAIEARLRYHLEAKRLVASLSCPDCQSLGGEYPCRKHDKNADYLEQDE